MIRHDSRAERSEGAEQRPDDRGEHRTAAEARLQEAAALRPGPVRPGLGDQGDAGGPFGADGEAGDEPQDRELREAPGERRQSREHRVAQDGSIIMRLRPM